MGSSPRAPDPRDDGDWPKRPPPKKPKPRPGVDQRARRGVDKLKQALKEPDDATQV